MYGAGIGIKGGALTREGAGLISAGLTVRGGTEAPASANGAVGSGAGDEEGGKPRIRW